MPRPRHATGRPNTNVFPADWATTGAAAVDHTLDCQVTIAPAGTTPTWNPERRQTETTTPDPVYAGPATISPATDGDGNRLDVAGEDVTVTTYEVKVPQAGTHTVTVGHLVKVTSAPGDAGLIGRTLRVTSVALDSRAFSRLLYTELHT